MKKDKITKDEFAPGEMAAHISPFQEPQSFGEHFIGAGHLHILVGIRRDIAARVPLILLTGEEGCGKSVLGQMIAAESNSGSVSILFDKDIDSFDDMVSRIAARLDIPRSADGADEVGGLIEQIAASLAARNIRLLLVCDGAEWIYLATLERLRKMMDRLNRAVVSMQLLLVGREGMLEHLRQLSICDLEDVEERRYTLAPLNKAETRSYIAFCRDRMGEAEGAIFTQEVADRIYQDSGGNFRRIHQLGEQICNRYSKDASFWVLLEHVEGGPQAPLGVAERVELLIHRYDPRRMSRRYQLTGGGLVLACLVAFIFLTRGEEPDSNLEAEKHFVTEQAAITVQEQPVEAPPSAISTTEARSEPAVEELLDTSTEGETQQSLRQEAEDHEKKASFMAEATRQQALDSADGSIIGEEPLQVVEMDEDGKGAIDPARAQLQQAELLLAQAQDAVEVAMLQKGVELRGASGTAPASDSSVKVTDIPVKASATEIIVLPAKIITKAQSDQAAETSARLFRPDRVKMVKEPVVIPATTLKETSIHDAQGDWDQHDIIRQSEPVELKRDAGREKIKKVSSTGLTEGTASPETAMGGVGRISREPKKNPVMGRVVMSVKGKNSGERVYEDRVAAGMTWLAGGKEDRYTLQLMVLTTEESRENIKTSLVGSPYTEQLQHMYILEKEAPSTIYVFLGEFDSPADAKAALDSLPAEVQKNSPYILTVQEALLKVR